MSLIQKLFASIFPGKTSAPPPPPPLNLLAVDGELIDLNTLSPAQLAALETLLLTRRQQQQDRLLRYLHELAAERHRLLASSDPQEWLLTLKLMFGEVLGRRVAAQDIGPGMQLQHLVLSLGQPDEVNAGPAGVTLVYGSPQRGSFFDLEGDVITRATVLPALTIE